MNIRSIFIPVCLCLAYHIALDAARPFDHTITFYIRQFPELITAQAEKLQKNAAKPSLSGKIVQALCPRANQGIICLYAGFTAVSNFDGQVSFPRMHQKPSFLYILTKHIKPIMMVGNTVHHWELLPHMLTKAYVINQEQDEKTKLLYWNVTEAQPPQNNIIPLNAIVLFVNPNKVIIPTGITLTSKSPNLVLPQLYAATDINNARNAILFLQIRDFYGPLRKETKKISPTYYSTKLMN